MFKIAKKNLILVKVDALYKNNFTSLWSFTIFFEFFELLLRIFIII